MMYLCCVIIRLSKTFNYYKLNNTIARVFAREQEKSPLNTEPMRASMSFFTKGHSPRIARVRKTKDDRQANATKRGVPRPASAAIYICVEAAKIRIYKRNSPL